MIAGIGATEFSRDSGRSELRLALEAILASLADARLRPEDVDGLVTLTQDDNRTGAVARALGLPAVRFFAEVPGGGGGGCGTVALAALAVEARQADVVVCYRAMNERSQDRFGQPRPAAAGPGIGSNALDLSWHAPYGLSTPAATIAMTARRYMHRFGVTSEDFGRVAVSARRHAASNPAARFFGKPITLDDHQASPPIADPLRLLDCCLESDGGVAIVVTREELLNAPGVRVSAAAQAIGPEAVLMSNFYRDDITTTTETALVGSALWSQSGTSPDDVDVAIVYDHFSPAVLMQLESLGFCGRGEAAAFVAAGSTDLGGSLPVNTHGGQLGEAYIHGFNGIAEAVRQLRGTAVNQVEGARLALVTSGSHVPTSGLLLSGT